MQCLFLLYFRAKVQNKSDNNGKKAKKYLFLLLSYILSYKWQRYKKSPLLSKRTGKQFVLKMQKWGQKPVPIFDS